MVSARDVAAYILNKRGEMTTMKLQKLLYYCQAWSLVWDESPLFEEQIEAWANGPVVREIYNEHRTQFKIASINGDPSTLSNIQRETIDSVLNYYGDKPSQWLSDLTHMEDPWKLARVGLSYGERGNNVISHASMAEYYSGLTE
ncbi:MAG: Panacea domain-containing protein [Candidatus Omnitrophota bacterium]